MAKRYYWLKLKEDFFRQKDIKKLRQIAGGDTFTIIYLKLLLRSLESGGRLFYDGVEDDFPSEMALDIDERLEDVQITVNFLIARGILQQNNVDEYELLTAPEMTGSEVDSAQRVRDHRKKHLLQCNVSELHCNTDETKCNDIKREDIELKRDREQKAAKPQRSKKRFIPPTVDEIESYCRDRGNGVNPQKVFDYYAAADWKDSNGKPVMNWKQKIISVWENETKGKSQPQIEEPDLSWRHKDGGNCYNV